MQFFSDLLLLPTHANPPLHCLKLQMLKNCFSIWALMYPPLFKHKVMPLLGEFYKKVQGNTLMKGMTMKHLSLWSMCKYNQRLLCMLNSLSQYIPLVYQLCPLRPHSPSGNCAGDITIDKAIVWWMIPGLWVNHFWCSFRKILHHPSSKLKAQEGRAFKDSAKEIGRKSHQKEESTRKVSILYIWECKSWISIK